MSIVDANNELVGHGDGKSQGSVLFEMSSQKQQVPHTIRLFTDKYIKTSLSEYKCRRNLCIVDDDNNNGKEL